MLKIISYFFIAYITINTFVLNVYSGRSRGKRTLQRTEINATGAGAASVDATGAGAIGAEGVGGRFLGALGIGSEGGIGQGILAGGLEASLDNLIVVEGLKLKCAGVGAAAGAYGRGGAIGGVGAEGAKIGAGAVGAGEVGAGAVGNARIGAGLAGSYPPSSAGSDSIRRSSGGTFDEDSDLESPRACTNIAPRIKDAKNKVQFESERHLAALERKIARTQQQQQALKDLIYIVNNASKTPTQKNIAIDAYYEVYSD
jgi:hypothetical protein